MKIVMIASLYRPYTRGGAESMFQTLVDELKKNHDVVVVTVRPWRGVRSLVPDVLHEEGVRIWHFFPLNFFSFITILKRPLIVRLFWHIIDALNVHTYFVIRLILKHEHPDIVLTHNLKGIGLTVPRAIAHSGIAHVHTVHDIQLMYPSGILTFGEEMHIWNRMMSFVSSAVTRMLFQSPPTVVFPSRFLFDLHARHHFFSRSEQKVLPNPYPATPEDMSRAQHASSIITFTFIGQLEEHKGMPLLLRAWSTWKRDDVRLIVAGQGSQEFLVREAAIRDPRIAYVGYCDDVTALLGRVSFVIIPSLCYENAPLIILESCAQGVPVVGARIGGIPEYVQDGVNGFLFVPGDERSLVNALERACAALEQYRDLSRHARESVRPYTIEGYCAALLGSIHT